MRLAAAVAVALCCGCSLRATAAPNRLPEDTRAFTVCEAIRQPVGERIRVRGSFGGFTDDPRSTAFSLGTDELCSGDGAAIVWIDLWNESERIKTKNLRTQEVGEKRGRPADLVTVEGVVRMTTPSDDRSIRLTDAVILP